MGRRGREQQTTTGEFSKLDLGHGRRTARGRRFVERLALAPSASLPVAMKTEADLEAAYRHLRNEQLNVGDVLLPHVLATADRVKAAGGGYVLHDTTDFSFGGATRREGLGHVNSKNDQGFRAHVSLAIGFDRVTPLGVLALGTSSRADTDRTASESDRWLSGVELASRHFEDPSTVVHVADRESDIYELMLEAGKRQWRFIFRAAQDRAVLTDTGLGLLFETVSQAQSRFEVEVPLSARSTKNRAPHQRNAFPARRCRLATLSFAAMEVTLRRPRKASTKLPVELTLNAVRVWEADPPEGEPPVEWILLTTEPIDSKSKVRSIVDGYRARWTIETFFNALKSGCAFERRQLESAHSLINLLGYCVVIAYAMLLYRAYCRTEMALPASLVLSDRQLECLRIMTNGALEPAPTAQEVLQRIASLGGHLKRNGAPGWRTLSRGFQSLHDFEQAFILISAHRA